MLGREVKSVPRLGRKHVLVVIAVVVGLYAHVGRVAELVRPASQEVSTYHILALSCSSKMGLLNTSKRLNDKEG